MRTPARRGSATRRRVASEWQRLPSAQRLGFAVDEVIHHNDVMFPVIVRPRDDVAARDPHPGDARIVEHDAEERQAAITRRGRGKATEEQRAIDAKVSD